MKTHVFAVAAVLSVLVGCASDGGREALDRSRDEAELSPRLDDDGEACGVEECFLITADQAISFIAVEGVGCDRRALDLSLWTTDDERIDIEPEEHGEGTSCSGISPDALKLEGFLGRETRELKLCVATSGSTTLPDLKVTTKAGRVCEVFEHDGACTSCDDTPPSTETTTSSSSSTSGAGGADTETTVSVTATVGVTTSVGSGAGGADTETTTSVTTTGGGEGGCGGAGEGGAATDVTATVGATTGGGEGGAGQGGMGEGGACDSDTEVDVGVDAVAP